MNTKKVNISYIQYIILIHGLQIGVGILTLPRELAEHVGTDGWITIILSWAVTTLSSLIIIQIMKKYPNGTILDLLKHYFGKWVGKLGTLLFAVYFAVYANVIFTREALFIQAWILPRTQIYILIFLLSIPSYLIVRKNLTILARYSELIYFVTIITIIFFLIPFTHAHWLHLLPVIKEGWIPILSAIRTTVLSFVGFEIAFFLYPFLQKKEKASQGIVIANTLTMLVFLIVTIGAYIFYSPDEITNFNEPTIVMLKVIEFRFIERLEIVFFALYIFVISVTVLTLMFLAVFCTSHLAGKQNHKTHLIWYLIITCITVLIFPPTFEQNAKLQLIIEQFSLILTYAFPICLWIYLSLHAHFKRRDVK